MGDILAVVWHWIRYDRRLPRLSVGGFAFIRVDMSWCGVVHCPRTSPPGVGEGRRRWCGLPGRLALSCAVAAGLRCVLRCTLHVTVFCWDSVRRHLGSILCLLHFSFRLHHSTVASNRCRLNNNAIIPRGCCTVCLTQFPSPLDHKSKESSRVLHI